MVEDAEAGLVVFTPLRCIRTAESTVAPFDAIRIGCGLNQVLRGSQGCECLFRVEDLVSLAGATQGHHPERLGGVRSRETLLCQRVEPPPLLAHRHTLPHEPPGETPGP